MANNKEIAVRARSPPESSANCCAFLPGGCALISTPVSKSASGSVSDNSARSEERRVGKECRSQWWTGQQKEKEKREKQRGGWTGNIRRAMSLRPVRGNLCHRAQRQSK